MTPVDVEHEHIHNWLGGFRVVRHAHPVGKELPPHMELKPHTHSNGRHSHPHGHRLYGTPQ